MDTPELEPFADYRAEFQEIILYLALQAGSIALEKADIGLDESLDRIGNFLRADRCYIYRFASDGEAMQKIQEWCASTAIGLQSGPPSKVPAGAFPWSIHKLRSFEIIEIPRVKELPIEATAERQELELSGVGSAVCVPLISDRRLAGLLRVEWTRPERNWNSDTIASLRILGELLANLLRRKLYLEERQRIDLENSAFSGLGRELSAATSPLDVVRAMLKAVDQFFKWDSCNFELYDAATNSAQSILNIDMIAGKKVELPVSNNSKITPSIQRAISEGPYVLMGHNPAFAGLIRFGDKSRPSASRLFVPIRSDEKTLGVFSVQSYREGAFGPIELQILISICEYSTPALNRICSS